MNDLRKPSVRTGGDLGCLAILDLCISHRSLLQFYHRMLCERVGIQPGSCCELDDLISQAVYDGRNRNECVKAVDRIFAQRQENSQRG